MTSKSTIDFEQALLHTAAAVLIENGEHGVIWANLLAQQRLNVAVGGRSVVPVEVTEDVISGGGQSISRKLELVGATWLCNSSIVNLGKSPDADFCPDAAEPWPPGTYIISILLELADLKKSTAERPDGTEKNDRQGPPQQRIESQLLDNLFDTSNSAVTARLFGVVPLSESLPDTFKELAQQYANLIDRSLEQRGYKVEHKVSDGLRCLAEELGLVKATPRDVVDIYTAVLKTQDSDATPQKRRAYAEETRLRVLELMGYLTSFYRNCSLGVGVRGASESSRAETQEPIGAQ